MGWCPHFSHAWSAHIAAHKPFACCFWTQIEGHGLAPPGDLPWQRSRGLYSLLPVLWDFISQDCRVSSLHWPSLRFVHIWDDCERSASNWKFQICFISQNWMQITRRSWNHKHAVTVDIEYRCAILRQRRKKRKTAAILAQQDVGDWSWFRDLILF